MAKIKFKNGGTFALPDENSPDAARGLRPFEYLGEMDDDGLITSSDFGVSGGDRSFELEVQYYQKGDVSISKISKIDPEEIQRSWDEYLKKENTP